MSNFSNFSSFPNNIQEVNNDYSPNIIKPPDRNITHGSTAKHLVIDSRDRDYLLYPNSNYYRVEIPQEWKDVTSIELTLAQIPNTFYNISSTNNTFYISSSPDNISSINIPEGQYNNTTLINAFNGKYGDLFIDFGQKLNFTRNPINLKLRIQSNRSNNQNFIYNLNYVLNDSCLPCKLNSIDKTIGFINKQYESSMIDLSYIDVASITSTSEVSDQEYPLYKLVANKVYNGIEVDFTKTFYVNDYFILEDRITHTKYSCQIYQIKNDNTIIIEEIDGKIIPVGLMGNIFNNMSILYSPNIFQIENKPYVILKIRDCQMLNSIGAANNGYTIIPLLNLESTIVNQATIPVHSVIKYFSVPLGKLLWLDVEFLNYDGSLFNFRGQENMMMFTVNMLNQPGKYNNYVNAN